MGLEQIVAVVSTAVLTTVTGIFIASVRINWKAFKSIQASQQALIKDRIVQAHDYFCTKGSIGKYSFATIEGLYDEYIKLGGNGFVKSMMDDLRDLPIH